MGVLTLVELVLNAAWLFKGFNFPLCAFHVIGRARLAWRSNEGRLADIEPFKVLFNEALNLNGVAEILYVHNAYHKEIHVHK